MLVFLLLSSIGPMLFLLVYDFKLGAARDWDIMAIGTYPMTLLIVISLFKLYKQDFMLLGKMCIIISMMHTFPWIWVNASETASVQRFEMMINTPNWTNYAQATARDELGVIYRDRGETAEALEKFKQAYDLTANNRYLFKAGVCYYNLKDYPNSLGVFSYLVGMKDSLNFEVPFYLATTYRALNELDSSIYYYKKSLTLRPEEAIVFYCLAYVWLEKGNVDNSKHYYELAYKHGYDPEYLKGLNKQIEIVAKELTPN